MLVSIKIKVTERAIRTCTIINKRCLMPDGRTTLRLNHNHFRAKVGQNAARQSSGTVGQFYDSDTS
jgi:ribosomal protein L16/L10AE